MRCVFSALSLCINSVARPRPDLAGGEPRSDIFGRTHRTRGLLRGTFDSFRYRRNHSSSCQRGEHRRPHDGEGEDGLSEPERDHTHTSLLELPRGAGKEENIAKSTVFASY
jgi:hypothetical protein